MQIGLDQMDGQGGERMRDHILPLVVSASLSKESREPQDSGYRTHRVQRSTALVGCMKIILIWQG